MDEERRKDYPAEKRRMEDRLLNGLIDVVERLSAVETTLRDQVKAIEKYNNYGTRIHSLEEYRVRCEDLSKRRRIPWATILASVISGSVVAVLVKFVI